MPGTRVAWRLQVLELFHVTADEESDFFQAFPGKGSIACDVIRQSATGHVETVGHFLHLIAIAPDERFAIIAIGPGSCGMGPSGCFTFSAHTLPRPRAWTHFMN